MSIHFDFTEVDALHASFGDVPAKTVRSVRQAVEISARNVKDDWRGAARGLSGGHARAYPFSITYDVDRTAVFGVDVIRAEIGPELGRKQAGLGILEDAPGGVKAAPQHAARLAMRANENDFIRGVLLAAADPLGT